MGLGWKSVRPLVFRFVLGFLFMTAGLAKIADPISFFSTLMGFRLFPDLFLPLLTVTLPWLELILGLMLLTGLMIRPGSLLLLMLNIAFSIIILTVVIRGIEIDCGCFGMLSDMFPIPDQADMKAVIRNLIFAAMSLDIFRSRNNIFSLENYMGSRT